MSSNRIDREILLKATPARVWRALSNAARRDMVSRARHLPSGSAANFGTHTDSSTRRDWTCRVTSPHRSELAAGCASGTTARSGRSPRSAAR